MKITPKFLSGIRELIVGARATVARGVDLVQVHTNYEIGRRIVEEEQRGKDRAAYGKEVLRELAERLTGEFGSGFSLSNLKSMRRFYLQNLDRISQTTTGRFDASSKSQTVSGQLAIPPGLRPFTLSWSHYVFLLGVKNLEERSFYEIEASRTKLDRPRTQTPVQLRPLRASRAQPRQRGHSYARARRPNRFSRA